jgi:hypothetical protein
MEDKRTCLNAVKDPNKNLGLFGLLSKFIGKDLSRTGMPIELNEPISMLQRVCETMEYHELLDTAAKEPDRLK